MASRAEALSLLDRARRRVVALAAHEFPPVLAAAPSLAPQLHALMLKTAALADPVPATALLTHYSNAHRPDHAHQLFDEMPHRDPIAYNAAIAALARHGLAAPALRTLRSMAARSLPLTASTLASALKACASTRAVKLGKQVHCRALVEGLVSVVLATALVDLYSSCDLFRDAVRAFRAARGPKDAAFYNSMLNACVKNRSFDEAFKIIQNAVPNGVLLTCALSACGDSSRLRRGKEVHCAAVRRGFELDTILCNALIDMYAKVGEVGAARRVFERMPHRSVVSWTSVINAYGNNGMGAEAWEMYGRMGGGEGGGVCPNAVTVLAVLSACGHSGMVDKAWECFFGMREKFGIEPGPEHYACFVDILGRAGRVEEAWDVYNSLDLSKVTNVVCISMLKACIVAADWVKGEQVAKKLLEIDPDNPGHYVLLSNFYVASGRRDMGEELRRVIKYKELKKETANSQIALEGCN